ncbi:MAG: zinc ribbon domain-containing protein, partial [Ruminococcus sp.]|nr:zinc ribbon domain-containing protein [Ruminococcus sp.]
MNCQNCGANVDGKAFCPQCGAQVQAPAQPSYNYNTGYNQPAAPQGNPTNVLVFGILGLALSELGIVGLIFSIIALKKANNYIATYGDIST